MTTPTIKGCCPVCAVSEEMKDEMIHETGKWRCRNNSCPCHMSPPCVCGNRGYSKRNEHFKECPCHLESPVSQFCECAQSSGSHKHGDFGATCNDCHKSLPTCTLVNPYVTESVSQSEGWTTTFLKAGTRELGIDCSILVGIVGNLIDSAKQEALSTLVKEMEGLEVGKGTEYNRGFNDGISAAVEVVNRLNK